MKKLILILIIFYNFNIFCQSFFNSYENGNITFRDGTVKYGLVKITGANKIKFKKTKKDKKIIYTHKELKKINFSPYNEHEYKISGSSILLLKKVITGKLNLYSIEGRSPPLYGQNGIPMSTGATYIMYYLSKNGSDLVEALPLNEKRKKYRKIFSKYISDCVNFSEYIKDRHAIKKNFKDNIKPITENIVTFYNEKCS